MGRPKTLIEIPCKGCGIMFMPASKKKQYHSQDCYWASMKGKPSRNPKKRIIKNCETCGEPFETGGRAGKISQQFCSIECSNYTIYPLPQTLAPIDAARLAGFFDGEGSIIQVKPGAWRITIYQNHEGILRWIQDVTGTGHIASRISDGHNLVKKPEPTRGWYYNLYGKNAVALLKQLLPYLVVKRNRALEMIYAYEKGEK